MDNDRNVLLWKTVDLLKGQTVKKSVSTETSISSLVTQFDALLDATQPLDVVLVEKQPHTNAKMRVMEGILLTFFKCRLSGAEVRTYSPRYKLKGQEDTKSYSSRKTLAVKLIKGILANDDGVTINKEDLTDFEQSKKKDDRADSMLMCLHYLGVTTPFV
jgi:hypothetical protein